MSRLDAAALASLEQTALAAYLTRQRWFSGKARQITSTRFADWTRIAADPHSVYIALADVTYADGGAERYQLPLTILREADAAGVHDAHPDAVLARVPGDPPAVVCDALVSPDAARALLAAVQRGATFRGEQGTVVATPVAAPPHDPGEPPLDVVRLPGVHSNTALTIGGRYLLKLFRRVEPGLNPDVEIGAFLARTGADVHVPPLVGSVEYTAAAGAPSTLALVQTLVPSRANGWEHALEELGGFFARAQRDAPAPRSILGPYLAAVTTLGRRTAELHRALASSATDPDFAPELASAAALEARLSAIRHQAARSLDLLARRCDALDAGTQAAARQVLDARGPLLARLERQAQHVRPFVLIRIHGDYHLGQVLRVDEDYAIIDFEGEPSRPLAERRAKQSPLRDVAGMQRSLSYAAHSGLLAAAGNDAGRHAALLPWARAWEAAAADAFLGAYRQAADGAAFMPADAAQFRLSLEMFVLDKALYELDYELNNRPAWASTPLHGILTIAASDSP